MITIDGKQYSTITDAVKEFGGVSTKTLREWITKGIIPAPPKLEWGLRTVLHFPREYIEQAKAELACYRKRKSVLVDKNPN
jgi:hypothetical protein